MSTNAPPAPVEEPTEKPDEGVQPEAPKTIKAAVKGTGDKPKSPGPAPWAKDLEDRGLNDPRFDEYLRESWQPRMTQFEQKNASYEKMFGGFKTDGDQPLEPDAAAEMASELLRSLAADPQTTVKEIMELMQLDPKAFLQVAEEMTDQQDDTAPEPTETDPRQQWIDERMQREQEEEQDRQWKEHLAEMQQADEKFSELAYTVAMAGVGPDPAHAKEWYDKLVTDILEKHAPKAPKDKPSATLGEGHPTPPEDHNDTSIKGAVKGFAQDLRVAQQGR